MKTLNARAPKGADISTDSHTGRSGIIFALRGQTITFWKVADLLNATNHKTLNESGVRSWLSPSFVGDNLSLNMACEPCREKHDGETVDSLRLAFWANGEANPLVERTAKREANAAKRKAKASGKVLPLVKKTVAA